MTQPIRLAIIGTGRMGRALEALAPEQGFSVVAVLGRDATAKGLTPQLLGGADIAIEFTIPSAAASVVGACIDAGCRVVSGTTGWDAERPAMERHVRERNGGFLWAPNFSIGVHILGQLVEQAGNALTRASAAFDVHIVETHHAAKRDAPSGTARILAARAEAAMGRTVPVTSVRTGHVPGTHEIVFDAPFEQITITHTARDRRVFAAGALKAAHWLHGRTGVYSLDDVLSP